jgi:hypothetical protein
MAGRKSKTGKSVIMMFLALSIIFWMGLLFALYMLYFVVEPYPSIRVVNSQYITSTENHENIKRITVILTIVYPFFAYIFGPYLAGRVQLSRRGYRGKFKQYVKAFYSGVLHEAIPDYGDVCHHKEFSSNNVSCLISFLNNNKEAKEIKKSNDQSNTQWTLLLNGVHQSPKRHLIRLIFLMIFILISAQMLLFMEVAFIFNLNQDMTALYTITTSLTLTFGIILFIYYLSRKKLKEMGYSKSIRSKAWVFFYTGSYFLPLPRHEEIATLPDFREDDIYSLINIQIQMYETKQGKN